MLVLFFVSERGVMIFFDYFVLLTPAQRSRNREFAIFQSNILIPFVIPNILSPYPYAYK